MVKTEPNETKLFDNKSLNYQLAIELNSIKD